MIASRTAASGCSPAQRAGAGGADAGVPLCGCRVARASAAAKGVAVQRQMQSTLPGCLDTRTQQQPQEQDQQQHEPPRSDQQLSGPGCSPALHSRPPCTGIPAACAPSSRPSCRQRSSTPEEDQGAHEQPGPITPTAAAALAPVSPATAGAGGGATPAAAGAASAAAASTAAAGTTTAAATRAATAAAQWRCCQAFMQCVHGSPLVQSALLSLELGGTFPAGERPERHATTAVRWTLAQLLAMHVNAGRLAASDASVLAALWLLESVESAWRSPATVCLSDYTRHLATFSQEAVLEMTADWKASFCRLRQSVVHAQLDLLTRLDWRLHLDAATEIQPCHDLLFTLPNQDPAMRQQAGSKPCPVPGSARETWAAHMHRVCDAVQSQAQLIGRQAGAAAARPRDQCSEEFHASPAKRQCTRA